MMSPSSANPAATAAPLRRFQPSRNWRVERADLGVVRVGLRSRVTASFEVLGQE